MIYNNNALIDYCRQNSLVLLNNYNNVNINRNYYIEGKCIVENCIGVFNKTFRQLVKTGGYCKSCMKNIGNNKIKLSKVKYDSNVLIEYCNKSNIILNFDYSNEYVNRDTFIEGLCKNDNCDKLFKKPLRELLKIGGYCIDCSKENGKQKIVKTNLIKFGVTNPMQNENIKNKLKQSILNKYGVEHILKLEKIQQQIREKSMHKYGVPYVLQSSVIKEKSIETNLKKYGVKNPQQNKEIKEKTMQTNLIKYGNKSPTGNNIIKQKVIQTNLERYGVPHHSQNSEVAELILKNSYNKKEYILPSGNTLYLQGYEPFMLDHLLMIENIDEDDIFTKRNEVPEIWYNDKNGKKRRHYVDFYIKSQNRCVEVKSTFTNQEKNNVFEKQKAAKDLGLKYEIWILNKEGDLLDKYI